MLPEGRKAKLFTLAQPLELGWSIWSHGKGGFLRRKNAIHTLTGSRALADVFSARFRGKEKKQAVGPAF